MRAFLDSDLEVSGNVLVDRYLGTRYSLTPDAAWILAQLQKENDIRRLVRRIASARGLAEGQAQMYVYALLSQLGAFGAVHVQWGRSLTGYGWVRLGLRWRKRRRATPIGFFLSMLQAYGWLGLIYTIFFGIVRLILGPAWPEFGIIIPGVLFGTCIVHEAGHVIAARAAKLPTVLLTHPGYASIMYVRPTRGVGRMIALSGPLAVAIACELAGLYCPSPLNLLLFGAGALHLISLLPWCSDGKAIWRNT